MALPILHAGGIGWDELLVAAVIAAAVGLIAYWIDHRGRSDEPGDQIDEPLTSPEREKDT